MKRRLIVYLIACALFALNVSASYAKKNKDASSKIQKDWYKNSYALVVGIDSYSKKWMQSTSRVYDALRVAQALKSRGFNVVELYDKNATYRKIIHELRKALKKTTPGDRFVFYFSGCGHCYINKKEIIPGWDLVRFPEWALFRFFRDPDNWKKLKKTSLKIGQLVPVDGGDNVDFRYIPMAQIYSDVLN